MFFTSPLILTSKKMHEMDTDLIRTNIRRKDYKRIRQEKIGNEPFYSTIRRIIDTLDTEKKDLAYMLEVRTKSSMFWKDKYFALKKSVSNTMDKFVDDEQ